jgi:hypothetical protein
MTPALAFLPRRNGSYNPSEQKPSYSSSDIFDIPAGVVPGEVRLNRSNIIITAIQKNGLIFHKNTNNNSQQCIIDCNSQEIHIKKSVKLGTNPASNVKSIVVDIFTL